MRRFALPLAVFLAAPATPAAADNIDTELGEAAKQVRQLLAGRSATQVHIGTIRSKSEAAISHGPGLTRRLTEQLDRVGLRVTPDARYGVVGEYVQRDDPKRKGEALIQLDLSVVDRPAGGAKLATFPRAINGEDALIELLAPAAVSFPFDLPQTDRATHLVKTIDDLRNQTTVIDGAVMYPDKERRYGVEVAVRRGGGFVPAPPRYVEGDFLIDLKKDDTFALRLRNNTKYDAGAEVLIDGINTFSFGAYEKAAARPRWVLLAGTTGQVTGWPVGGGKMHEFLVTSYADSAAAKFGGDEAKLGVLTVLFTTAWDKAAGPPPEEAGARSGFRDRLGIGLGKEFSVALKQVDRQFGPTRAVVSVRYSKN